MNEFLWGYGPIIVIFVVGVLLQYARHLQHKSRRTFLFWYSGPVLLVLAIGLAVPDGLWQGASWQAPVILLVLYLGYIIIYEGHRAHSRRERRSKR